MMREDFNPEHVSVIFENQEVTHMLESVFFPSKTGRNVNLQPTYIFIKLRRTIFSIGILLINVRELLLIKADINYRCESRNYIFRQ